MVAAAVVPAEVTVRAVVIRFAPHVRVLEEWATTCRRHERIEGG